MGSSPPKSETTIRQGKPTLVQDYVERGQDLALADLANYWQERALQSRAGYNATVNNYLSRYGQQPAYQPLTTTAGRTIDPNVIQEPFDASKLVPSEKFYNMAMGKGMGTGAGRMNRVAGEPKKTQGEIFSDIIQKAVQRTNSN
jgi:hypothetical protein